jgi:uncharacterized protein YxeA
MIKKIIVFFLGLMLLIPSASMAASNSSISIDTYYLVVSPTNDGSTNMMVMAEFSNPSSKEYKGDGSNGAVLNVTLPEGATGFNFLDNTIKTQKTATGFMTTQPIKAKGTQVLPYSYQMPKGQNINLKFDYPVQTMQVLVPQGMGSVTFQGVDAVDQGTFQFDGQNYNGYDVAGITAGQSFSMAYDKDKQPPNTTASQSSTKSTNGSTSTSASTAASTSTNSNSVIKTILISVIILLLIAAVISLILYLRKRETLTEARSEVDKEEEEFKLLISKQKTLLEKILELEENHDSGSLTEADYSKKLAAYKEHLVQVKLGLRKFVE